MSKNKKELFRGAATALITPFSDDGIDYKALDGLIDFQLDGGISALVVAGTTGEAPTLSYRELEELFSFAADMAEGKAKIIAGCGGNSTERAKDIAIIAKKCGCDGILAVTPYYNKPSSLGLTRHFLELTEAGLPTILYNVPSRTGVSIDMDCYRALSKHPLVIGVKEASGNISAVCDLLSELGDDLDVYTGNDDMTVPTIALGGKGCISVVSNLLPLETNELCRLCLEGNYAAASELQLALIPIIRAMFKETNPIPIKYALSKIGFCQPVYRLPLCPPTEKTAQIIDLMIKSLK